MTREFSAGNYRFIPSVFQYSAGAAADDGYEIERVRFDRLVPLAEGFAQAAKFIQEAGRPLTAFCACELRSPAAFSEEGFRAFNLHYVKTLSEWGIFDGTTNPVARSNVCPEIDPPSEPSFYAFSFTRPTGSKTPSFVIAGGAGRRCASRQRPRWRTGWPPSASAGRTRPACRPIPCTTSTTRLSTSWFVAARCARA